MSFTVEVDWAADGFGDYIDDVTSFVLRAQSSISLQYGRDQSTALAPTVAGRGSFVLNNQDRRFSPRNTDSLLYGLIKPSRPVQIKRTIGDPVYVSGSLFLSFTIGEEFTLFRGHTDDSPINPDVASKTVNISLIDNLADFRNQTISTELYSGVRTGQAIHHVLDACGWPADKRDIDPGATLIPWWWADNKDAAAALEEIVRSEGPPALLTMGSDGSVIFQDRHYRLLNPGSLASQSTWNVSGGTEPVMGVPFTYDEGWRNIVNDCTASVDVRTPKEVEAVWTSDTTITLNGGEQKTVNATTPDPFYGAIVPENGTDYTLVSGSVTVTLLRTSGATAPIVLTAGGGGAVIQGLQLRANSVTVAFATQVSASDTLSIADYGSRSNPGDLPWCNIYDAQSVLDTIVAQRGQPNPIINVRFMLGNNLVRCGQLLPLNQSDRATVVEPETGLNNDFYIEEFQHEATGTFDHAVTFGLEKAPEQPSPLAITDSSDPDTFTDSGKTAGIFDDPDLIAITDSIDPARFTDAGRTVT